MTATENVKTLSKTTTLHVHHTFWYIFCQHCTITRNYDDGEFPHATFYGARYE